MRTSLGNWLLGTGVAVGVVGAVGLALGVQPHLSPFMLKVVVYKLIFAAAAGLLVAGATIQGRTRGGKGSVERSGAGVERLVSSVEGERREEHLGVRDGPSLRRGPTR
jgi:hypothetical protein